MAITDLLRWGGRRSGQPGPVPGDAPAPKGPEQVVPSKALPRFIAALANRDTPVLVDFGPVIGGNVAFFGEQLGCKLFIEDLTADIDRHSRTQTRDELPKAFEHRLPQADGSVDGILCWDVFDFLDKAAAQTLAKEVVRVLRPGGAVMGFFSSSPVERASFTKFEIVDQNTLRHRYHQGVGGSKAVLQNRDIIRMFEGLAVSDSFLLKNNTREILLRKKA